MPVAPGPFRAQALRPFPLVMLAEPVPSVVTVGNKKAQTMNTTILIGKVIAIN